MPNLRCGMTVELTITSTNEDGFGVCYLEGTRVLVAGGLPGEMLVVRITYVGRRESFGNIIKLLKTSADREAAPACGMGKACDGCPLIQMRYPAQLAWKKNLVQREMIKYPSLVAVPIHDTIASPKLLEYRNTAKLVVAGKHSDPVIGIYRRNTHDVLEIADCPLHHPLINKVVKAAKAGIKKGKVPIYNPKSEMGLLRYLVVRVAEPSDRVMVVFVTSDQGYNEIHHLAKFVQQAVPEVDVVAQNINASTGNVIFGHKDRFLTREHTLRAYVGEKSFHLSPHSFFQVNSGAANIIYEKVRELARLSGKERVIDVYCGIGGISLFLADKAREVVGIEFVEAAVTDATANALLNKAQNCSFEAGDAAHLIDEIGEEGGADLVVLNPPRKGCEEKVLKSVAAIKPERIVYVSCSPETLARDLDILSRLGYRTVEINPVDMFPQTVHVEDVALLERV
ncbi:23S rRNA (uracil(1939)-C(5))-methyltransferase RlmD [Geomonas sp. Red32]|uniref:23S rRNA (uracil(1939)-C(5))-methyltransferase RlmD n=1 Tax=Geomonas sp. Red32 TaxID=2912856 RepID=UPI00202D09E7|nr:23S rRNA (uracil(1939)-C(5))-methyltransferase RlmD [Geomonas sp. Red32]MCM0082638.1 23S rRNA (uracil(1939)-C(5))-methyltransferase RlmD [Geomonas sp. Red32]